MIREDDFLAVMKVFHGAIMEMAEKETAHERIGVIKEWMDLMRKVDHAMGVMIGEKSKEKRQALVAHVTQVLKEDFGYEVDMRTL